MAALGRPAVPLVVEAATGALFAALTAARGTRIFHPDGLAFRGRLSADVPVVREHPAVVRFSRGLGLPRGLPDVLGCAVKLPDLHGPGRDQDLLLVTAFAWPPLHAVLRPAYGFLAHSYSSLLPYEVDGARVFIRLVPETVPPRGSGFGQLLRACRRGPLRFRLCLARPWQRGRGVGTLTVDEPVADADRGDALRFNPWNTGERLRPVGVLQRLRDAAYRGSQHARGMGTRRGSRTPAEQAAIAARACSGPGS